MTELPLWPGAQSCVRSGFCCKQAPCGFGEVTSPTDRSCNKLGVDADGRYCCTIAEQIVLAPGWELSPAFGSGCCSSLNPDRQAILRRRAEEH